jgi:isopentenyl-diphosphate delta-isomerase
MSGERRKMDHLRLCTAPDPSPVLYPPDRTTLLECVELLAGGFPRVAPEEVDAAGRFLGRSIAAPLLVSAMTGGPVRGGEINRALARVCQRMRIPLALGSGRPMLDDESRSGSFEVRGEAPDVPILANIGFAQAARLPTSRLAWMVRRIDADALVVHLNFAMEAVQPEGDREPHDVVATLRALRGELGCPLIVKEVGQGFTPAQLRLLVETGVEWIDVAGAGGTNWIRLEGLRAGDRERAVAETFGHWGMPTAACIGWARRAGAENVIAGGGIRTGLDVARALALGASLAAMALPLVRALEAGGEAGLERRLETVIAELKLAAHLCGCRRTEELGRVDRLVTEPLATWLSAGGD